MWTLVVTLFFAAALVGFVRWVRSIPTARAWYPESHDKMTCYALDILQQSGRKTLFGWVLGHIRNSKDPYREYVEDQLRRASIDEDMYSHTINVFSKLGLFVSFSSNLVSMTLVGRALFLGLKYAARKGLERVEALEGANGGYHFYNPHSQNAVKGLSEPVWVALMVNALSLGDTTRPMPSAVDRAFEPGGSWGFDNEARNYCYGDANRYYRDGYAHLAFYALGRVGHLLQDMCVPAHVRDDSHFGIPYVEGADPLEHYAGDKDWRWHKATPGKIRWGFDPDRLYSSTGDPIFDAAQGDWENERTGHVNQSKELFEELARWAYAEYYSYGTIPGNADSHNPDNTDVAPLFRTRAVDWSKADPNVPAMWEVLKLFAWHAGQTYRVRPKFFTAPTVDHARLLADINRFLADPTFYKSEFVEFLENFRTLERDIARTEIDLRFSQPEQLAILLSDKTSEEFLTPEERSWRASWFWLRATFSIIDPHLIDAARAGVGKSYPEIMQDWVDRADQPAMVKAFAGLNGPCYLNPRRIAEQYVQTQQRGIAFTAHLFANWFESLYEPSGEPRGIGVWRNQNATDNAQEPPLVVAAPLTNNGETRVDAVATIGVANHFPMNLDLTVEFELIDDDDDEDDDGGDDGDVVLELEWGHLGPVPSTMPVLDVEGPERKKTYWNHASVGSITLTKTSPKQTVVLTAAEPYNLSALDRLKLPNQGAIRREEEADKIKPLNLVPGGSGSDDMNASLLRIVAKTPDPTKGGSSESSGAGQSEPASPVPGLATPV